MAAANDRLLQFVHLSAEEAEAEWQRPGQAWCWRGDSSSVPGPSAERPPQPPATLCHRPSARWPSFSLPDFLIPPLDSHGAVGHPPIMKQRGCTQILELGPERPAASWGARGHWWWKRVAISSFLA